MTREEAWQEALDHALEHHRQSSRRGTASTQEMLQGLYVGLRELREKLTANTLLTSDLVALIACALDCLGSVYYDAKLRGEKPLTPEERQS